MRRFTLALVVLLFMAAGARAQFTTATAIVLDPNGVPYANCSGNAAYVPSPSATLVPTINGSTFPTSVVIASCDSFGAFTIVLADNNFVVDGHTSAPASQWRFNIAAQAGTPAFQCTMTITGLTENISAPIQACAPPLPSNKGSGAFIPVFIQSSATPNFSSNGNTAFTFTLNQNVTSSTFTTFAASGTAPVYQFNICENPVGNYSMVWPANVTLPPGYTFNSSPNACSPVAFVYNPNSQTWTGFQMTSTGGFPALYYQTLQNNGVGQTQQTFLNFLSPLVLTPNPGNHSSDLSSPPCVGVGVSHLAGIVTDPGSTVHTPHYYFDETCNWSAVPGIGATVSIKPDSSVAVQYVAATCTGAIACVDMNDGLSWGTAKLTIYNALCTLPGGTCGSQISGSGTVNVGPAVSANPTSGAGIWLMGSGDPNYASPPAGWLKCTGCVLNIIGSPNANGGPNSHTGRAFVTGGNNADRNHPALWINAGGPIDISNIAFSSSTQRGVVMGECSNNDRTGTCATAGIVLSNVGASAWSGSAASGPAFDITGGSFWIWLLNCGSSGNAVNATGAPNSNISAGVLLDGTGNGGDGLIYISDMNMASGGIKVIPGANGASLYTRNITEEGDFVHPMPPVVWFTSYNGFIDATLENTNLADPGSNNVVIENDGQAPGPFVAGSAEGNIVGPATILSQFNNFYVNTAKGATLQRQTGMLNGYMVGETNVARRIAGLVPTRFVNKAASSSTNWTSTNIAGAQTITQSVTDPFGGTGAATASSTSATAETLYMQNGGGGCTVAYTPTVGDWLVAGAWVKGGTSTPPLAVSFSTCGTGGLPTSYNLQQVGQYNGDGQWEWEWLALKISGGSPLSLAISASFNLNAPLTVYGPVLYIIPSGTISDNDAAEFAASMNSIDTTCAVASICNVTGHPLNVDAIALRNSGFTNTITSQTLAASRATTIADPGATAIIPIVPSAAITNGHSLCASGTAGLYIDCTGSAGNVNNALQYSLPYYSAAGSANTISGISPPTGVNGVTYVPAEVPSGGAATAPAWTNLGIVPNSVASCPPYVIAATDAGNGKLVHFNTAGACPVTLNAASTYPPNSVFAACDDGAGTATITPTTSTIAIWNGATFTAVATSLALTTGQCANIFSDNTNYYAIYKTASSNATCDITSSPLFGQDPSVCMTQYDEFDTGTASSTNIGRLLWSSGGSGAAVTFQNGTTGTYGVVQCAIPAAQPDACFITLSGGGAGSFLYPDYGTRTAGGFKYRANLVSVATPMVFFGGVVNTNSGSLETTTDYIGIAFNSATDTNWMCVHRQGSNAATRTSTGVAATTGYHDFVVHFTAAGTFTCTIDGSGLTTVTPGTFTTSALTPEIGVANGTTATVESVKVDYWMQVLPITR